MDEKLRKLMKQEGINSTRLAEILGIQASGISHIMSGRNKPSYDFLLKLLQRFPQINPDWLLLGKGPMYRQEIKSGTAGTGGSARTGGADHNDTPATVPSAQRTFFEPDNNDIIPSGRNEGNRGAVAEVSMPDHRGTTPHVPISAERQSQSAGQHSPNAEKLARSTSIERIVVFFKDKTFSEYQPE